MTGEFRLNFMEPTELPNDGPRIAREMLRLLKTLNVAELPRVRGGVRLRSIAHTMAWSQGRPLLSVEGADAIDNHSCAEDRRRAGSCEVDMLPECFLAWLATDLVDLAPCEDHFEPMWLDDDYSLRRPVRRVRNLSN